ncbi:YGR150C-like protein [Saccharomyces cerevisiae x Saccharomyces kudriavzevii VIN7]|uniref:YGR150C-like protein n=1 Tax=Saccharomyces cerevisiae x Saccharomyces kudriavzevii (strain VIN7) TaxID=1095631 RepID=H0GV75_SACCK|nr:YGR150C-like protein [Saccharomyces cerevisiae x Saccharomyces kudriavzevii VIN7]
MYMVRCGLKTNVLFFSFESAFVLSERLIARRFRSTLQIEDEKNTMEGLVKHEMVSPEEVEFKLAQLREFTKTLKSRIYNTESPNLSSQKSNRIPPMSEDLRNSDSNKSSHVTNERSVTEENKSNDLSYQIHSSFIEKINDLVPKVIRERVADDDFLAKYLLDRSHRNWAPIIDKLYIGEKRLTNTDSKELSVWLKGTVKYLPFHNILQLDEMLLEQIDGDVVKFNTHMYECIFNNLGNLKPNGSNQDGIINDEVILKMKELLERYDNALTTIEDRRAKKQGPPLRVPKMTQSLFNSCLKYSTKCSSFNDMEYFITKFRENYGISPNKQNLTTVIQFYSRKEMTKQAWNTFDTMKFLSTKHFPDIRTYNTMLQICEKERNFPKALDLFQEIQDHNIKPTTNTYIMMARVLAASSSNNVVSEGKPSSLRLLGWNYLHELEEKNLYRHKKDEMNLFLAMMALAAYDGDVELSKALYYLFIGKKYKTVCASWNGNILKNQDKIWKSVLSPEMLNYLMLAYARFDPSKLPILSGYEKGIELRRKFLCEFDSFSRLDDANKAIKFKLPFLPINNLNLEAQVLAESSAIWNFNLENGGTYSTLTSKNGTVQEAIRKDEMLFNSFAREAKDLSDFKFKVMYEVTKRQRESINVNVFNRISLHTYLTIPINLKHQKEFLERLTIFTFQQHEFEAVLKRLYENCRNLPFLSDQVGQNQMSSEPVPASEAEIKEESTVRVDDIWYITSLRWKIMMDTTVYELVMKAATEFQNEDLAKKVWNDRGKFRTTIPFLQLDQRTRVSKDQKFAHSMVEFFTKQGKYSDAMAIVLSSKNRFNWTYSMVKNLHQALEGIEDSNSVEILLDVVNKKSHARAIKWEQRELQI